MAPERSDVLRTTVLEQLERVAGDRVDRLVAAERGDGLSDDERREKVVELKEALTTYEEASNKLKSRFLQEACNTKVHSLTDERLRRRKDVRDTVDLLRALQPVLDDISSVGSAANQTIEKVEQFIDSLQLPPPYPVETKFPLSLAGAGSLVTQMEAGAIPKTTTSAVTVESRKSSKPKLFQMLPTELPGSSYDDVSRRHFRERSPPPRAGNNTLVNELNRLNISPFEGKPATYWSWRGRILQRMSGAELPPQLKLLLLQENTRGEPREMIADYLLSIGEVTEVDVDEIWALLRERYGSSDKITEELLDRIDNFPAIRGRNIGQRLQKFYDLCKILLYNQRYNPQLRILDTAIGLRSVRGKLPEDLQIKWREYGQSYKTKHDGNHPPFSVFTHFLRDMANQMADGEFTISTESDSSQKQRPRDSYQRIMKTAADDPSQQEFSLDRGDSICPLHERSRHSLVNCISFKQLNARERKNKVTQWHLCFACLRGGHGVARCRNPVPCGVCGQVGHHTLLHFENAGSSSLDIPGGQPLERTRQKSTERLNDNTDGRILRTSELATRRNINVAGSKSCSKTVLVDLFFGDNPNRCLRAYAILDEQSTTSLLDQRVLDHFGREFPQRDYSLNFASDRYRIKERGSVVTGLHVRAASGQSVSMRLPQMLTTREIADTKHEVASPEEVALFPHIKHLAAKFSPIDPKAQVLILIGRDCGQAMWCRSVSRREPYAYETALGWALVGQTCRRNFGGNNSTVLCTQVDVEPVLPAPGLHLANDPFIVLPDDEDVARSRDDAEFLSIMNNNVRIVEGSIELPIPVKQNTFLPDNRLTVRYRTANTLKRLRQDEERWLGCVSSMKASIDQQHVEEVTGETSGKCKGAVWYLPIFPVYNKKGKTRLVFDASAKCQGTSLNDNLLQGPDLNNSLRGVLLRFREKSIGFMTDIASMFNTFRLPAEQRDLYRFYWTKGNTSDGPLVPYRSLVHLFGSRSSPAVASFGLNYAANHGYPNVAPEVVNFLRKNFYVDDGIASAATVEEAVNIIKGARESLSKYNIRLHKIMSSSEEVLQQFPPEETAGGTRELQLKDGLLTRALGVVWDPRSDCFSVNVTPQDRPFTRRGVLSVVNSLYDPLGLVSPIVLTGRLIMRAVLPHKGASEELFRLGWDDPLPPDRLQEWSVWVESLKQISSLKVPRCFTDTSDFYKQELHVFADASQLAIGYVIYVRTVSVHGSHVCLMEANSRVAPRAATTIPRLELCAALESAVAMRRILRELSEPPKSVHFYSDSMIVLGYLRNTTARYTKYIARRVEVILSVARVNQWHYVSTNSNPADFASRPTKPYELINSRWTRGPEYLWQKHYTPEDVEEDLVPPQLPEQKVAHRFLLVKDEEEQPHLFVTLMTKLSDLDKLVNVVSMMMRLGRSLDHARQRLGSLQVPRKYLYSRNEIMTILTYHAQRDSNHDDVCRLTHTLPLSHRSPLFSLCPYLDEDGLLRVGGRIRRSDIPFAERHPIFLASKHVFTLLVLKHHHEKIYHQGRVLTQAAVRQAGYHLQKGGQAVRSMLARCVTCKRLRGAAAEQMMADLPVERLENVPPFTNIGMDVFGPFIVHDGLNSTRQRSCDKKVWVLIMVCLVSRAIHLEPLANLEASTFMNAFRRFQAVRGCVVVVRTDRGTNFISIRNRAEPTNIQDAITELRQPLGNWKLHPPRASHFAGSWERKIGSVRSVLNGALVCLHRRNLSRDEFATYLAEASAIVNNTPLCDVSLRHDDPSPITPAHLLTGKINPNPPTLDQFTEADIHQYGKTRWRRVQHLAQEFWTRWRREYVTTLQERQKWIHPKTNLKPGDVVLVKEKNFPRNTWPLAKVEAVRVSQDGRVRSVALRRAPLPGKSQPRILTRCIQDLTVIFPAETEEPNCPSDVPSLGEGSDECVVFAV